MKTRIITYISVLGIILLLVLQTYTVYENLKQTHNYLIHESDVIIEDAFSKELNQRNTFYKHLIGEDTLKTPPLLTKENTALYDMNEIKAYRNNISFFLKLVINRIVSKTTPINLHNLDSITGTILQSRNIHSKFAVYIVDTKTGTVLDKSRDSFLASLFVIRSKNLPIDLDKKKSLQLVLISPFESIFKRMGALLVSSLLLALFSVYALWYLFRSQARQKKLLEMKNDFFGNTAHELKRPVAQLRLALEALSNPALDANPAKKQRYLSISREATMDMSEKITMIMTLSMAEEGVFKLNYSRFNLVEEVEKLKEKFSTVTDKDVSIQLEKSTDDVSIMADKDHLLQCIANLIDNAIKYSGSSVLISISIAFVQNSIMLSIKDNGIGIKSEKLGRIFEKYTRLNTEAGSPAGFGIGLSYVKTVVEKHLGQIEVKSEFEKGSEFTVYLPV